MRLHRRQEPTWYWRYKRQEQGLEGMLLALNYAKRHASPEKDLDHWLSRKRVGLHPLDFTTGETWCSNSTSPFFMPTDEKVLYQKKNQPIHRRAAVRKIPLKTRLSKGQDSSPMRDLKIRDELSHELENYRIRASRYRRPSGFKSFKTDSATEGRGIIRDSPVSAYIPRAAQIPNSHRIVTFVTDEYNTPEINRPSATEMELLIAMIKGGMQSQRRAEHLSDKYNRAKKGSINYIIPALIISIYPGAQVRVLYGYLTERVHIHYTEPQQFTEEKFEEMMEKTLRWAMPATGEDITRIVMLDDIEEIDETEEEPEKGQEKEAVEGCAVHVFMSANKKKSKGKTKNQGHRGRKMLAVTTSAAQT
ncbi:hypothetical protein N7462_009428 [Penicillium macrosclerotiorum]|uniref:uncharacterized protein n=1 Tax=Penicillium macrosclerotiorum TaxID=303699 RepID=UPI0025497888|nr:uncharacterized protein N7462_009428 [Penicillium macrosclerotiorum]KAJ5673989.1 hypothetical protein N7462_009428 [Penicillium macrosclerotiorum]